MMTMDDNIFRKAKSKTNIPYALSNSSPPAAAAGPPSPPLILLVTINTNKRKIFLVNIIIVHKNHPL